MRTLSMGQTLDGVKKLGAKNLTLGHLKVQGRGYTL
jgi:hypothetical protein